MKLTNTAVKNAKPREKSHKLFDGGGLYLEVMKTGAKYWRMKYRCAGKEKRLAIGVYPEISLKQAREKREEAKQLLAEGIDPSEHKQTSKRLGTIMALKRWRVNGTTSTSTDGQRATRKKSLQGQST